MNNQPEPTLAYKIMFFTVQFIIYFIAIQAISFLIAWCAK